MSINSLEPNIRITIMSTDTNEGSMFGRGVADLCAGVRSIGSLNAAAKQMHMAYSKAWRIIKETEKALGIQLLDRDGAHGSTLTKEGEALLNAYLETDEKIHTIANEIFQEAIKKQL